jgi:2-oxoglutarate ferredoxin oxidoreductase subunit alpha
MQEGISFACGADLPMLIVNVMRGGPGLGTIQPSQSDYFQSVKGGGHGDYKLITLAPSSVQEMADFVDLGFTLSFKYRIPCMILSDGVIGQMMEKVILPPFKPRRTTEELIAECPWAATGKPITRERNIITSLDLDPYRMEKKNEERQDRFRLVEDTEVLYEEFMCEDADYMFVAFGSAARICQASVETLRSAGVKVGLIRPITLWPFPAKILIKYSEKVKFMLTVELNAGQMIEDVRLSIHDKIPVYHYGRMGGIVPTPEEVTDALRSYM